MKIVIASGKGGTGKTTLATNFAHFLGVHHHRVVLTDLDVEEPNSKLFIPASLFETHDIYKMIPLWQSEGCTQCGECVGHCNYNALLHIAGEILVFPNLCHSCYACSELCAANALPMEPQKMGELCHYISKEVDLIEGRLNVGEEQAVSLIAQTKAYVERYFSDDTIKIFDAPPGTSCPMVEATKGADRVVLVSEPTPFGVHDLSLAVETLRVMHQSFGVVINKSGIGDGSLERYLEAEGIEVFARIPHQRAIAEHYAKGGLIYPHSPAMQEALLTLAKALHVKELA